MLLKNNRIVPILISWSFNCTQKNTVSREKRKEKQRKKGWEWRDAGREGRVDNMPAVRRNGG